MSTTKKYTAKELLNLAKSITYKTSAKHSATREGEFELLVSMCLGEITAKQVEEAMNQAFGLKKYNAHSRTAVVFKHAVAGGDLVMA